MSQILPEDGFGMKADDDDERVNLDEQDDVESGEEPKDDADENSANEESSIASPQPHPDDLNSSDDQDQDLELPEETAQKVAYVCPR